MLLGITPVTDEAFNCFDGLFMSVARYFHQCGYLAFSEEWRFNFDTGSSTRYSCFSDRISIENNLLKNLKKYYGIRSVFHPAANMNNIINIIRDDLEKGYPTALQVDKYWVPWSGEDYFMKSHIASEHFCLTIGVDTATDDLYCMDTLPFNECAVLPRENFLKGCSKYISFEIIEPEESVGDWRKIIDNALTGMVGGNKNAFNSMREFALVVREIDLYNETARCEYVWEAPVIKKIKGISDSRRKFALAVGYLGNMHEIDELKQISDAFDFCRKKWLTIYRMFLKACIEEHKGSAVKGRIRAKIEEAASMEESLFYTLQKISRK